MGKHDIKEDNSFYKERIKKLEAENATLKNTVIALERDLSRMDRVYDNSADRSSEIIAQKDAEIESLKAKIVRLVEKYV